MALRSTATTTTRAMAIATPVAPLQLVPRAGAQGVGKIGAVVTAGNAILFNSRLLRDDSSNCD